MGSLVRLIGFVAGLLLTMAIADVAGQSMDPLIGTWELNIAKSRYSPGPPPRSETRTYVLVGREITATSKGVGADGAPTASEWTVSYDGNDRPQAGSNDADSLSYRRIDDYVVEFTEKRRGVVVITGTRVISRNGKVMTTTTKGVNVDGQTINDVVVFDKR